MLSFWNRMMARARAPEDLAPIPPGELSVASLQREVALFQADFMGVQSHVGEFGLSSGAMLSRRRKRELRRLIEESDEPCLLVDPRPGLRIVEANGAFAEATLTTCSRIAGDKLFSALPGNPVEDNIAEAFDAYKRCAQLLRPYALPQQRFDIRTATGAALKRCWRSTYLPVVDDSGALVYILNRPVPIAVE